VGRRVLGDVGRGAAVLPSEGETLQDPEKTLERWYYDYVECQRTVTNAAAVWSCAIQ